MHGDAMADQVPTRQEAQHRSHSEAFPLPTNTDRSEDSTWLAD